MAGDETLEPLKIDANLWSHRDLLERMVSRQFRIIDEASGIDLGWQVDLAEGETDASEALDTLNVHLKALAWVALLQEGEPYDLIILPEPPTVEGLTNGQMMAVWAVFTFFLTLAGSAWLQLQRPGQTLLDQSLISEAFTWFALPVMATLLIASESRRRIGLANGVDLGHHLPLAVPFLLTPSSPIWPFGVLGFLSQRRMDLIPFRDRVSLALISGVGPLMMIIVGTAFTVLGYRMTSLEAPALESAPILVDPSFLSDFILGLLMPASEVSLRSAWLHPLAMAGITLTTLGWILLLPLPGFPGDRLLTAIIGPDKMSEGSTQTQLFIAVLVVGIFLLLNGGFWPWVVLVGLGAWRRFSPEASMAPFVLDEVRTIPNATRNRFAAILVITLLLGFPGIIPVKELDDWDAGLDTSDWPVEIRFSANEVVQIEFPLRTEGVVSMDVEFQFRWLGAIEHGQIAEGCGHPWESCTFQDIGPGSEQILEVEWPAPILGRIGGSSILQVLWLDEGQMRIHDVNLIPDVTPMPQEIAWSWDGDVDTPRYCINVTLDDERAGNLTIDTNHIYAPLFSFDGEDQLAIPAGDEVEVCITGLFGAHRFTYISAMFAPDVLVTMDDGTILQWSLPVQGVSPERASGAWPATASGWGHDGWDYIVLLGEGEPPICPIDRVRTSVPTDENGSWELNLSEIPLAPLPEDRTNGTIILPESGRILVCGEGQQSWYADLVPANGTLDHAGGRGWPFVSPLWVNEDDRAIDVEIETAAFGVTAEWNITDFTLAPGQQVPVINGTPFGDSDVFQLFWFEPDEDVWTMYIVAHCIAPEGCSEEVF